MFEVINKFVKVDNDSGLGYEIHTNEQIVRFIIDNGSSCCESWGFITTEDTLDSFLEAELLSLAVVDMAYDKHPLTKDAFEWGLDEGSVCFVDVNTSKGVLQFALYNIHNGYYGHSVEITSKQLDYSTVL